MDHITKTATIKENINENTIEEINNYINIRNYINYDKNININNISILDNSSIMESIDNYIDDVFCHDSFLKYKEFFYKDKINRFNLEYINIAIHIRRLSNYDLECNRYEVVRHSTPNSYYLDKMNLIRNIYSNKQIKFHIYSQGDIKNFSDFISDDVIFHLNENTLNTFTDLIFADILITSVSSFSYTAALLSNNQIWYLTFGHPPLKHWKVFYHSY
jgi:hypothetical protein